MGYVFIGNSLKARVLRPFVRFLMRAALGGDRARLILQNPDDINLFLHAGLAPRAQRSTNSGLRRRLRALSTAHGAMPAGRTALGAAGRAHALGQRRAGVRRRGARAQGAGPQRPLRARGNAGSGESGGGAGRDARRVESFGRRGMARSCGRHAGVVRKGRHCGSAELPRRLAQKPDGGRRLRATARRDRCSRLPRGDPRRRDGLLVPVGNSEPLAKAIGRLLDDPALARRLGEAARARALAEFDERKIIDATLAIYREIVPPPRPHSGSLISKPAFGGGISRDHAARDVVFHTAESPFRGICSSSFCGWSRSCDRRP